MKFKLFTIIAVLLLSVISTPMFAVHKAPIKANTEVSTVDVKKAEKMEKKLNKFSAKLEKKMAKKQAKAGGADVDFDDPVDKWMWLWIFGWGAGLVLTILGSAAGIGIIVGLGTIAWVFGIVALILWLVKKFS